MSAFNLEKLLIGRGSYCNNSDTISKLTDFGSGSTLNTEAIIKSNPDIVLMSKSGFTLSQVDALKNAGICVLTNDVNSIQDLFLYYELIGNIFNVQETAVEFISEQRSKIDEIHKLSLNKIDLENKIYFEISPLNLGLWTAGKKTYFNDIADILCLNNCYSNIDGFAQISQESLLINNPDIIVCGYSSNQPKDLYASEMHNRPAWTDVSAVKNNKIICIDQNYLFHAGPNLILGIEQIYKAIYE